MVGERAQSTAGWGEQRHQLIESASRWTPGGRRESIATSMLRAVAGHGWTVLHDVQWPGKRIATIDHVVIGGGQVWVIAARKWSGSVTVTGGVLKENGRTRQKYVAEVAEMTEAIAALSPMLPRSTFHPILCLEKEQWVNERFGDVWLCSTLNLVTVLETPPEKGPDYVHNDLVRQLVDALRSQAAAPPPVPLRPAAAGSPEAPPSTKRSRKRRSPTRRSRNRAALLLSAGLVVAAAVFVKPDLVTAPVGSITDEVTGIFLPGDDGSAPADEKTKKPGPKGKKAKQRERQEPQQ